MSTYLLVLTPQPIPDCDYPKVFTHLIGCNPAYDGLTWNGTCRFFKPQGEDFWPSLIQMNDDNVPSDSMLTVVWAADPLDELVDRELVMYRQLRAKIHDYIDEWAGDLGSKRGDAYLYSGHVGWVLRNANTAILTDDFASAMRSRFQAVPGGVSD